MLRIDVEFLLGTFRGAGSDDLSLAGGAERAEWPPSPGRLFAALVAGGVGVTDHGAMRALEAAPPPSIDAPEAVCHTPLADRFVVDDRRARGSVQEYPARGPALVRPGARVAPASPNVSYWWDADLTSDQVHEIRLRCARVGYLGSSDSPARVSVQAVDEGGGDWRPAEHGSVLLPVPDEGSLDELDRWYARWQSGETVRGAWIRRGRARYARPNERDPAEVPTRVYLKLARPLGGRFVLAVTEALRAAVLGAYERLFGRDAVPAVLHGHDLDVAHASWLALPAVGHEHADGRIRGVCVVLPPGVEPAEIGRIRQAVGDVIRLYRGRAFDVGVEVHDGATKPWSANPTRWERPARHFATAFPFVHERHVKGGPTVGVLTEWLAYAGLPEPREVWSTWIPLIPGAADLAPHEVHRGGRSGPYGHLWVSFDEPVVGPVAVGRMRHFGLGLLTPAPDPQTS